MTAPARPSAPPQALRSNPSTFSANAEQSIQYQWTALPAWIEAMGDFVDERADAALAAAIGGDLPPLTGHAGKFLRVNAGETGVEFAGVLGIDQTWQVVTLSRYGDTVYQNTTDKPICVYVGSDELNLGPFDYATLTLEVGSDSYLGGYLTGVVLKQAALGGGGSAVSGTISVEAIIPPGHYYMVSFGYSLHYSYTWLELR